MPHTRIYVVQEIVRDGLSPVPRLVNAISQSAAIRHVIGERFEARAAAARDVGRLMGLGVKLEVAGESPEPKQQEIKA